jgi:ACS family tartrate transporter-like MFS transporter
MNYLDRTNVGFAALTMNTDLGFSPSVYGLGAGIFFVSYSLFQVPANLMLHRVGARRWIFLLLATWGAAAAASALIRDPASFYGLRFLLGVAEAGFFPGIILYLNLWFPKAYLGRFTAIFMSAPIASLVIGGPLASLILGLDGLAGIRGWQWLFLLEGLPACLIGVAVLKLLPDGPSHASWLGNDERNIIATRIKAESSAKDERLLSALLDLRVLLLGLAYGGILFAIFGLNFWLALVIQGMGFSNTATGFIAALVYAPSAPAMILWGASSDRKGERIWHVALAALFAAAALVLASIVQSDVVLLLALAGAAMGMNSVLAPFYSVPALFLSGRAMAGGFALISTIGGLLGGFAGQYVIGVIREQTGGYAAAFAAMGIVLVLSAVIVIALARTLAPRATIVVAETAV